jgi:hypothetical protein
MDDSEITKLKFWDERSKFAEYTAVAGFKTFYFSYFQNFNLL